MFHAFRSLVVHPPLNGPRTVDRGVVVVSPNTPLIIEYYTRITRIVLYSNNNRRYHGGARDLRLRERAIRDISILRTCEWLPAGRVRNRAIHHGTVILCYFDVLKKSSRGEPTWRADGSPPGRKGGNCRHGTRVSGVARK